MSNWQPFFGSERRNQREWQFRRREIFLPLSDEKVGGRERERGTRVLEREKIRGQAWKGWIIKLCVM